MIKIDRKYKLLLNFITIIFIPRDSHVSTRLVLISTRSFQPIPPSGSHSSSHCWPDLTVVACTRNTPHCHLPAAGTGVGETRASLPGAPATFLLAYLEKLRHRR